MKLSAKFLSLFPATCLAFVTYSHAQLVTYETQTGYAGSVGTFTSLGGTVGETFTNVSSVASMTYNFFAGAGNGNTSTATDLTAVFGQWNGSSFVNGTTVSFGTITIPASTDASWSSTLSITGATYKNYSYTFDLKGVTSGLIDPTYGYLTNASDTYALLLTDTTGNTNLGLGLNFSNPFTYGAAYPLGGNTDYVFSQIVVTPGSESPVVPESSTVASALAALFVAGIVVLRLRQRRRQQLAPIPVAAI